MDRNDTQAATDPATRARRCIRKVENGAYVTECWDVEDAMTTDTDARTTCPRCNGAKEINNGFSARHAHWTICNRCNGTGTVATDTDARAPRTTGATHAQIKAAMYRSGNDLRAAAMPSYARDLVPPEFAIVPRAMLERIVDANDRAYDTGTGTICLPDGHWQDITGWTEEALVNG